MINKKIEAIFRLVSELLWVSAEPVSTSELRGKISLQISDEAKLSCHAQYEYVTYHAFCDDAHLTQIHWLLSSTMKFFIDNLPVGHSIVYEHRTSHSVDYFSLRPYLSW
jgi:hypothetical protein